jgi:VWFA-related protein
MTSLAFLSSSRFRRRLALAALAVLLGPSGRSRAASGDTPSFPVGVEVITVDAIVYDSHDRPVSGLTRDDFSVFENNQGREIVSFEAFTDEPAEPGPATPSPVASNEGKPRASGRAFVLIVDDLRIGAPLSPATRNAVQSFLEHSVRDGDEVTLGTTSGSAWWSARLPEGREDLLAVLGRVKGLRLEAGRRSPDWMTDWEAYWINTHEETAGLTRILPDNPDGTTSNPDLLNPSGQASIKDKVSARWKDANVCSGTSCDGMVRGRASDIDNERKNRTKMTLDAVRRGLDSVAAIHGRKSILLFSEGFVDDPESDQRKTVAASREANAAIYFVNVRGLTALNEASAAESADQFTTVRDRTTSAFQDAMLEAAGSESMAEETGGFTVRNTNDLAAGAERIAAESRVFYLLGVQPLPGKSDRSWRKLRVEVNKAGLKVRARRGYTLASMAEAPKPKKKDDKKPATIAPAVAHALDTAHDATDIPLRAMSYVFEPLPKNVTRVLVAAEFDATGASAPAGKGHALGPKVDFSIVATHRDTGTEFRFDQVLGLSGAEAPGSNGWRAVGREIELPPGVSQVRVVVRDPASGAMGSLTQRVDVPAEKAFRLSSPIITDRVEPASGGNKHPQPAVTAHRTFLPSGGLYIQFEVFGAAKAAKVDASLAIRTADGKVVRNAPSSPITADANGRLVRTVGIGIDGLDEGRYTLALDVKDEASGESLQRDEPFTLTRTAAR